MGNFIKIIFMIFIPAVLTISSCITAPVGISESNIPLQNRQVRELGEARGRSSVTYSILGFWMIGRPRIDEAIKNAIDSRNGDAIINVRIYQNYAWFVLFGISYITVNGNIVVFENTDRQETSQ